MAYTFTNDSADIVVEFTGDRVEVTDTRSRELIDTFTANDEGDTVANIQGLEDLLVSLADEEPGLAVGIVNM